MYDEEEEEIIEKIKIPKYRIIHLDLELNKALGDVVNSMERVNTQDNVKKEELPKINFTEKILECKILYFLLTCLIFRCNCFFGRL